MLPKRDDAGNIIQAGVALGEFQNINYAKDIISLLILQTNNPIVDSASLTSTLSEQGDLSINPAESAIRFFIQFSDPTKTSYSWNRSLASSKNSFISGTLAMYFGFASEYKDIAAKNPHLNFDVSTIPQIQNSAVQATFARVRGLAISKTSPNAARALTAISQMLGKDFIASLTESSFLPPVRRDLLAEVTKDPTLTVFYKAAIQSRAWLEPDPTAVFSLFENMIESVKTGKRGLSDAVSDANRKLDSLLLPFKDKEKSP